MFLFDTLPDAVESYILWLACGANNLDTYNKKNTINAEITFFKNFRQTHEPEGGVYLKPIGGYQKTPELHSIDYSFGSRYLLADYGISKKKHDDYVVQRKINLLLEYFIRQHLLKCDYNLTFYE
jgi:hypothetical protein